MSTRCMNVLTLSCSAAKSCSRIVSISSGTSASSSEDIVFPGTMRRAAREINLVLYLRTTVLEMNGEDSRASAIENKSANMIFAWAIGVDFKISHNT